MGSVHYLGADDHLPAAEDVDDDFSLLVWNNQVQAYEDLPDDQDLPLPGGAPDSAF